MKIGNHTVSPGKSVFIVAEAGINHTGSLKIAKKMIYEAAKCGVDAIKFQTIFPEELFSETLDPNLYDFAKKLSFTMEQHKELKKYAQNKGIQFFSTPLGKRSTDLLEKIGVNVIKIASGELTNHELIKSAAKKGKPLIISTGMATIKEIDEVVKILKKLKTHFSLLHCNSSYPTPIEEANLETIPYFQNRYNVPVGYSDHVLGNDACILAVSMGACIIEKHFTLDKKMEGPDQKLSADPKEFLDLVKRIRSVEKLRGKPRDGPTKSEKKSLKLMRKSIAANTDIPKGSKVTKSMVIFVRPGTGISPKDLDKIIGKRIKKNVQKGNLLNWKMF